MPGSIIPPNDCFILLETGDPLLLEAGGEFELQACPDLTCGFLLEDLSGFLLLETGDTLLLESC